MNIRMDEDLSSKNAKGINRIYHETLLLMKFLQTKPQVKNTNNNFSDLCYTIIKTRNQKESVNDPYENDYINFIVFPNHYSRRKDDNNVDYSCNCTYNPCIIIKKLHEHKIFFQKYV